MGHKMTHIDGRPVVIGGYEERVLAGVEYWTGDGWEFHQEELEFERWAYGMPSYIPKDKVTCGNNAEPTDFTPDVTATAPDTVTTVEVTESTFFAPSSASPVFTASTTTGV